MSLWKIGVDDVSPEEQQFKDKLASKDGQIAAQQALLVKQQQEFEEVKASLNEALLKLATESEHALHLENDLTQCKEDLRNEKNASRNLEASLETANNKLKVEAAEARNLEATIERLSGTSNDHNARAVKLEHDKTALEARVRELESNARQLEAAALVKGRRVPSRTSSAQFNDLKIRALENELKELREKLAGKDGDLITLREKLSHVQGELLQVGNEAMAKETKVRSQLQEMRSLLQEKDEELEFYRAQQGSGGREDELLQRIEEDEAKIEALEAMLKQSNDARGLKEKLRNVEQRLKTESERVEDLESQNTDLVRDREEMMDELEDVQNRLRALEDCLQEKQEQIDSMKQEQFDLISVVTGQEENIPSTCGIVISDSPEGVDVSHVAKLLEAIARLRCERNDLRRSLEFLETEHKFVVEALEKRQDEAPTTPGASSAQLVLHDSDLQSRNDSAQRLARSAAAYAVLFMHSQAQLEQYDQTLLNSMEREQCAKEQVEAEAERSLGLERRIDQVARQLRETEEERNDLETRLEVAVLGLEAMTRERDGTLSQLEMKDMEWEDVKVERGVLQDRLEEVETHLKEASRTLEAIESDRDSLALQVTNLTAELHAVQVELESAESRCSALQSRQLSSLSSGDASRAFREQIEALEARVMRRTEQIGIHQHDIRRLETNLKLQEERLGEMTMELEVLATQKEAMLEDCADAREARDEALVQVENLEVELEVLESKLADNDEVLNNLICLLIQTTTQAKSSAQQSQSRIAGLEAGLEDSRVARAKLETDLVNVQTSQTEDLRQLTVALATTQLQFAKISACVRTLTEEKACLVRDLVHLKEGVEVGKHSEGRLKQERGVSPHESSTSGAELAIPLSEYQVEIDQLKKAISEIRAENEALQQRLAQSVTELEKIKGEKEYLILEQGNAKSELVQLHKEEVQNIQERLSVVATTLEEERASRLALEQGHAEALSETQSRVETLKAQRMALTEEVSQLSLLLEVLQTEKEKVLQDYETLQAENQDVLVEKAKVENAGKDLAATNERLSEEVEQLRREQELTASDVTTQTNQRQQELEFQKAKLQSRVDELSGVVESTKQEIQHLTQELGQARHQVRDNEHRHVAEIQLLSDEREAAQSNLSTLRDDITKLQSAIQRLETALAKNEEEKDHLQENITSLEAQVQKSLSYTYSLERQVQDGERASATLKTNLNNTQLELTRAEKAAKAAEMQISVLNSRLSKLQDKLASLEPRRNLEEALASLEEKNNEMEELLKAKCAEIEENDDRALEMLKENKKLSNKVEVLTRKVQNLQTKLMAAKAVVANTKTVEVVPTPPKASPQVPAQSVETGIQPARRRSSRLSTGTDAPLISERTPVTSAPKLSATRASGPLPLPPKTPEGNLAPTPVFKPRPPEQPPQELGPPPVVGVKRRAPDDFETYEAIPPQGFTVDSLPSREGEVTAPRVRKPPSNLHSGFTPKRNKALSSPKRQSAMVHPTPRIQDVTNSPRSSVPLDAKQSKRSWLGKIRGTSSSQGPLKPVSRQVFTHMGESNK